MEQLAIQTHVDNSLARVHKGALRMLSEYTHKRKIIAFFVLLLSYGAGSMLNHLIAPSISPAIIWLPAGIALAALFLEGITLWPAILLASLLTNLFFGASPLVACSLAIGDTLQGIVGASILRRTHFDPLIAHLQDVILLILVSMLTTTIAPTLGYAILYMSGASPGAFSAVWGPWWLGNILSDLIVAPFIVRWSLGWPTRTLAQWLEWIASFCLLILLCYMGFWTPVAALGSVPLIYAILFPLIWMALSIGPRGVTLALFVVTALSIGGTLFGSHATTATLVPLGMRLVQVELLDVVLCIVFLTFVSSEEGRKSATKALREHVLQLEDAVSRISAADKAKNEFLAILAHELRNPLAPLLSSLELLQSHKHDPEESAELIATMEDRVHTLARLLDDLLDISRISQKKFRLQRETVDLNVILERSAKSAQVLMQSKEHTLTLKLMRGPVWISGDPVRLEQIIINLLNNAAKYTPPGGTIVLESSGEKEQVVVRVRDSGIGIPKEMLARIFEPFLQVDSGRRSEGLGIGLSLTKRLIELHHGTIEAHSEGLARGSEFVVRLPKPAAVQLPIPTLTKMRRNPLVPSRTFNILLVDDNILAAESLGKLLSRKGHSLTLAHDAASALQSAQHGDPEVIILDIGLPDMDGYSVARQLRERGTRAYLIALTGYGQEEDRVKAQNAGFDHHLTKPVGLAEVESVLAGIAPQTVSASQHV